MEESGKLKTHPLEHEYHRDPRNATSFLDPTASVQSNLPDK